MRNYFTTGIYLFLLSSLFSGCGNFEILPSETNSPSENQASRISFQQYCEQSTNLLPTNPVAITITALRKNNGKDMTYSSCTELETYLRSLKTIDLRDIHTISDLGPLATFIQIQDLRIAENSIENINALSSLVNLRVLILGKNKIKNIGVLSNFKSLEILELQSNKIEDLTPLSELYKLQFLSLENNSISNVDALKGLSKLSFLNLRNNQISSNDLSILKNSLSRDCQTDF